MKYVSRLLESHIRRSLARNKSVLLFGARQTGKTTLVGRFDVDLSISFIQTDTRHRYEKAPHLLRGEVEALSPGKGKGLPLVLLDEVQKVPEILDVVQEMIDDGKARFILTGSSARKLRRHMGVNLLPGRVSVFKLPPFSHEEFPGKDLDERLLFGALPGILAVPDLQDRELDLESYVVTYLEEEVRAEAAVRNLGHFARFLELAASESGEIINLRKLSQEIGVSHTTIGSYFQILEDCLILERFEPLSESKTRKKLTRTCKYLFFDLGVRRLAAREGTRLSRETIGKLFEQFVGLELLRVANAHHPSARIRFWRDPDGPEVDWVIDRDGEYIPVEVKLSDTPFPADIRHLMVFLSEYKQAKVGYLVCRAPRKIKLAENIIGLPWQNLPEILTGEALKRD